MFLLNKNHLVFICSLFHLNRILYQCTKKEENKISKASSFTLITAQTYPLAVIGQVCVTSITVAHLSALIPPSHFTPFLLPLHKLCCQWGLVKRNDLLSLSQLVTALPDWSFDRCYHGSLTTEQCEKPHLPACDWQAGISPLSQTTQVYFLPTITSLTGHISKILRDVTDVD